MDRLLNVMTVVICAVILTAPVMNASSAVAPTVATSMTLTVNSSGGALDATKQEISHYGAGGALG